MDQARLAGSRFSVGRSAAALGVACLGLVMGTACGGGNADSAPPAMPPLPPPASAEPPTAAPPAAPAAEAPAPAPEPKGRMARCPNTVGGAKTTVRDTQGGVELEISVAPESLAELRTRAKYQADVSTQTPASSSDHAGKGTGGGAFGRCPVVAFDTKVTYADTPTGVKLTVLANDSSRVEWLRKETRSRDRDLNARTDIADAGQRKMANCPSAAAGAKTVVKEQKGSMVITVTGADDGAVKEIRARAGRLVEASKAGADPTAKGDARHTGGGTGGGSLGSCPVVLAETSVAAKEVAGGTEITVKPRKAADFSSLKKETLERQERWSVAAKGNK